MEITRWNECYNDGTKSKLYLNLNNNPDEFADDTDVNYVYVGDLAEDDDYIDTIIPFKYGIFPTTVGDSSSTKIGDYFYTNFDNDPNSGWRTARRGGLLYHGLWAGLFYWNVNDSASADYWLIGARLVLR